MPTRADRPVATRAGHMRQHVLRLPDAATQTRHMCITILRLGRPQRGRPGRRRDVGRQRQEDPLTGRGACLPHRRVGQRPPICRFQVQAIWARAESRSWTAPSRSRCRQQSSCGFIESRVCFTRSKAESKLPCATVNMFSHSAGVITITTVRRPRPACGTDTRKRPGAGSDAEDHPSRSRASRL